MSQEIGTLPLGPIEVSSQWFARARLAFSTLGVHIWAAGGVNEMHTVCSRVMENTSGYTMAALWDLLKARSDMANYDHFVIWADGGSHLKTMVLPPLP